MPKYSDETIDIADLKMLRDILSSDNRKLEIDIIDALGDIYALSDEIINNEDMIKKNYKFTTNTFGNFIKSSVFSVASYAFVINYLDKDPDLLYSVFNCILPAIVGYRLFQKDNVKENYVSGEVLKKATEDNFNLTIQLEDCVDVYFASMMLYFGKNASSIKEKVKNVFDKNEKYIETNIEKGRFLDGFSYEKILEVAGGCLDDKLFKEFVSFYESKQKQRKK